MTESEFKELNGLFQENMVDLRNGCSYADVVNNRVIHSCQEILREFYETHSVRVCSDGQDLN